MSAPVLEGCAFSVFKLVMEKPLSLYFQETPDVLPGWPGTRRAWPKLSYGHYAFEPRASSCTGADLPPPRPPPADGAGRG